ASARQWPRDLGVAILAALHGPGDGGVELIRSVRNRVIAQIPARAEVAGGNGEQRLSIQRRGGADPRGRAFARGLEDGGRGRRRGWVRRRDRGGGVLQLHELRVEEVPPERRDDDQVDERERGRDDADERDAEPPADTTERVHRSRKR